MNFIFFINKILYNIRIVILLGVKHLSIWSNFRMWICPNKKILHLSIICACDFRFLGFAFIHIVYKILFLMLRLIPGILIRAELSSNNRKLHDMLSVLFTIFLSKHNYNLLFKQYPVKIWLNWYDNYYKARLKNNWL